ncbi:MAG TPA: hypothetical protein VMK32_02465 [Burkholderiaceae bacterium]|nr:hypothetical protein [Burkholderiaceae bacterium]
MHLAASDFRIDLSLNFLSLIVSGAIALALVWYLFLILSPLAGAVGPTVLSTGVSEEVGPPAWAAVDSTPALPTALPVLPRMASVVTVFRCESHGRVTYADRPCEQGGVRVLRLPRP